MGKNIMILILAIVLFGQSVALWVQKPPAQTTTEPPAETISTEAASSLARAVEVQNQICCTAPAQIAWLREHLEKCICVLEKKYDLELTGESEIPLDPLVCPYIEPDCSPLNLDTATLKTSIGFQRLAGRMNLRSSQVNMINPLLERQIEDYAKRLRRLEPAVNE